MTEKQYKTMTGCAAASLTAGIIMAAAGLAAGIVAIVSGAKLLANRKNLTF